MLPRRWMEAYINFLLRQRWIVLGLAIVLTAFFVYQLGHTKIQMNFLDFYPPGHPYMQLVKKHARMFGSANVLVMAVEVKQGDIFTVETLNKIDRLTIALLETPGVNGWQVLSISHPKMRNIEISSAGIQALPLFFPGPPKTQAQAARIKKAVCTNDGILGVHVSYDTQMALMTTGRAILFTGTTLTASVIFWLFFPMKFQAEMAFLLALVLFLHIVGALVFIPSMVSLLKPRFAVLRSASPTPVS